MDVMLLLPPPISLDPQHQLLSCIDCPDRGQVPCGDMLASAGEVLCEEYSQCYQVSAKSSHTPPMGLPLLLKDMMEEAG